MSLSVQRLFKCLRLVRSKLTPSFEHCRSWMSTTTFVEPNENIEAEDDDFLNNKNELKLHGVDPKRGWNFRGVHKAVICGKVGQVPVQKILRNGRTVTILTVGTGGMFDQWVKDAANLPRPVQWHRIVIHNEEAGVYAVQQLDKSSTVFVEGDIETRVYNDSINGIKNIPEICVRHDGKLHLIKTGPQAIPTDKLKERL